MDEMMLQQEQTQEIQDEAEQAEIQRMIAEAVAQARAEWEAEAAKADAERARIAGMTDAERADYQFKRREEALAEREQKLIERELRAMAMEKLAERGLPQALADVLPYSGEEACLAALTAVEQAFRSAVQTAIDERLRGDAPVAGIVRHADPNQLSDEDYYKTLAVK